MQRTYKYRDKLFMYDSEALQHVESNYPIDVFEIVREGIDTLIAQEQVFHRVTAVFNTSGDDITVEVKPA